MFTAALHPTLWHQERDQGGGGGGLLGAVGLIHKMNLLNTVLSISPRDLQSVAKLAGQACDWSAQGQICLYLASTHHLLIVAKCNFFFLLSTLHSSSKHLHRVVAVRMN